MPPCFKGKIKCPDISYSTIHRFIKKKETTACHRMSLLHVKRLIEQCCRTKMKVLRQEMNWIQDNGRYQVLEACAAGGEGN